MSEFLKKGQSSKKYGFVSMVFKTSHLLNTEFAIQIYQPILL